jgi:hypothetical protein
MRKGWNKTTLSGAIADCHDEIYELSESMREAFEGTPEVFKETKSREIAADKLEAAHNLLHRHDIPKGLHDEEVEWMEMSKGSASKLLRPTRRDNVVRCLQACVRRPTTVPQDDDVAKLKNKWQRAIDILRGVHFPGMRVR